MDGHCDAVQSEEAAHTGQAIVKPAVSMQGMAWHGILILPPPASQLSAGLFSPRR